MSLKLYNTLTRKKEDFKPIKEGKVGYYACGPTVYNFVHIGNLRAFVFDDLLYRVLKENAFDVTYIMNITDVGHLVGDGDEGQDKMIVAMQKEGKSAAEIALFYTKAFARDAGKLNLLPANDYPKATEHIDEQIEMVKQLEANGFTYTTSDGVYFDTSKLDDYGKLSGQSAEEKQAGARVDMGEKKNATDFALWKFSPKDAQRDMEWESPWGVGFPGWHIECSAMSAKYLDVPFDIHTGGVDHIAVHHENELAQTKGAVDALQANYWVHNEFLTVDGGRMGKSLGNAYTIADIEEKGFDPLAFRYLCLQAHYRSKLNFTWDALEGAANALKKLQEKARGLGEIDSATELHSSHSSFMDVLNDDLNTAEALAIMWKMLDDESIENAQKAVTLSQMDRVLGLQLEDYIGIELQVPTEIQKLIEERDKVREEKDFDASDRLRNEIESKGYIVDDTPEGTKVRKA